MRNNFLLFLIIASIILFQSCPPFLFAEGQKTLSLDINEVSRLALENNFDIQIYRLDKSISEKELLKAQSVYDATLDASYEYNEDRLERSSIILGSRAATITQTADLSKKLPTGTILSLSAKHTREATNSSFSSLNPYHESESSISITQPLAKNSLGVIDRNTVKITGLDVENSGYTSLDKIEQALADTQKAYWNLLLAYKQVGLTEEMAGIAKNLYKANKKNFDIGMIEPPELYAVEANLKERQRDVLLANDNLNSALNLIKLKLNLDKETAVMPKDDFKPETISSAFEDAIKEAIAGRRDYKAAKNKVKAMDLKLEMKKNSLWPQIDLKGTLKKNGIAKKARSSVRQISSDDYPEYTAEVIFSFPLENSAARAEYSQQELEKIKALVNLKKTECLIFTQTHDAFMHAKNVYDSVILLREAMGLLHNKYLGEEDRFKKGRSDTDRLIRYQNDYLYASLVYLKSLYDYETALIDLKTVMNRLLQEDKA